MTRQSGSTGGDFNDLLLWLNPDRDAAAIEYEEIRQNLIQLFARNGCHDAEGMAEETIARVTERVIRLAETFDGPPALFFYGVAKKQLLEYPRQRTVSLEPQHEPFVMPQQPEDAEREERDERVRDCLEECLRGLKPEERELTLRYYEGKGQDKINNRKLLAEENHMALNALRVRVLRIRTGLRACIEACLERGR
jgi:RNA polymerase sigma factor (sigma-70 family)